MKKLLIAVLSLIVILLPVSAQKKKQASGKEPLFGKAMASYPIVSNELSGACFYLVGGHGGPDPGLLPCGAPAPVGVPAPLRPRRHLGDLAYPFRGTLELRGPSAPLRV